MIIQFYIIIIIIIIIIFSLILIIKKNINNKHITVLIRQSARWAVAAQQDLNPIIRLLHANYAAGYLWALFDIANPCEIKYITGVNIDKFKKKITDIQDMAVRNIVSKCDTIAPIDNYLAVIAGES